MIELYWIVHMQVRRGFLRKQSNWLSYEKYCNFKILSQFAVMGTWRLNQNFWNAFIFHIIKLIIVWVPYLQKFDD